MSTILKALRRLEREKSTDVERPLSESVASPLLSVPPEKPARGRRLWILGSLAVLASAGAAAFFLLPQGEEAATVEPVTVAAAEKPPAASSLRTPRRRATRSRAAEREGPFTPTASERSAGAVAERQDTGRFRGLPPAALTSDVEVVKRVPIEPTVDEMRAAIEDIANRSMAKLPPIPAGVTVAEEPAPAPKPASAVPAVAPPKPGSRRPGSARSVQTAEAVAKPGSRRPSTKPSAEETLQVAAAAEPAPGTQRPGAATPEPELAQVASVTKPAAAPKRVAQRLRSPVPNLVVERTVWHPLAERRVAVIEFLDRGESMELHEGDAVGPLVVKAIEPSGVIFVHDGVEVSRRVGAR